jgi:hypothetical protein
VTGEISSKAENPAALTLLQIPDTRNDNRSLHKILGAMARAIDLDHRLGVLPGLERTLIELELKRWALSRVDHETLICSIEECLGHPSVTSKERQRLIKDALRRSIPLRQALEPFVA